jgi:hypothetical protein
MLPHAAQTGDLASSRISRVTWCLHLRRRRAGLGWPLTYHDRKVDVGVVVDSASAVEAGDAGDNVSTTNSMIDRDRIPDRPGR